MTARRFTFALFSVSSVALAFLAGCHHDEPKPDPEAVPSAAPVENASPLVLAPPGIRIIHAPADGDVPQLVVAERKKAKADGRDLVVYVGAKWCEPCQRFHAAAEKGELDDEFPTLSILEFDLDRDRDRLHAAGYESHYIPLFTLPAEDGRASPKHVEGGPKGEHAAKVVASRLKTLVAKN